MEHNIGKKRIVVKIGSSSLTTNTGGLNEANLHGLVDAITLLKKEGHEVILVSSGAVAAGFSPLGYPNRPVTLEGKQAAAAVGQGMLIQAYNDRLATHDLIGAQILLTRNDFSQRNRYQNAYNVLNVLLKKGIVPIINENDTVAVDELTFGDNDMLSALVSGLLHADHLIILTDTDGLYDSDPRNNPQAKKIDKVYEITPEIEALAGGSGSNVGTGGMRSKINAAKLALSLGAEVFIGTGNQENPLLRILHGNGPGTYFINSMKGSIKAHKQWIAFHANTAGIIRVDEGAAKALIFGGKSLLPSGVHDVLGSFLPGHVVEVIDLEGTLLGKGITNYSDLNLLKVKGKSTTQCKAILNMERAEVIHRDHWVSLLVEEKEEV